jgi:predicted DsbA family dithiol-disulfide isomerase
VPHIIVDQRWAVSGAQPAHTFMPLFDAVIASRQG